VEAESFMKVSVECMQSMMLAVKSSGSAIRGLDDSLIEFVD
jgi:hypothetical protein